MSRATVDEIMDMISFPLPPAPFPDMVLAELKIKIDDYNYTDASCWADIDPKDAAQGVLHLEQKPDASTSRGRRQGHRDPLLIANRNARLATNRPGAKACNL